MINKCKGIRSPITLTIANAISGAGGRCPCDRWSAGGARRRVRAHRAACMRADRNECTRGSTDPLQRDCMSKEGLSMHHSVSVRLSSLPAAHLRFAPRRECSSSSTCFDGERHISAHSDAHRTKCACGAHVVRQTRLWRPRRRRAGRLRV